MTETATLYVLNTMLHLSPHRHPVAWREAGAKAMRLLSSGEKVPERADIVRMSNGEMWERMAGDSERWHPVKPAVKKQTQVGDVNSNERGAGARYNGDKPPMQYVPMSTMVIWADGKERCHPALKSVLMSVQDFQQGGGPEDLHDAIACLNAFDLKEASLVLAFGAEKYAPWNWLKGMDYSVFFACISRHAMAMLEGEDTDPESGRSHWAHIVCNLIMLAQLAVTYPEGDDRPDSKFLMPAQTAQLSHA